VEAPLVKATLLLSWLLLVSPALAATLHQPGGPAFLQTDFDHDLEGWSGEYRATGGRNYSSLSPYNPAPSGYVRQPVVGGVAVFDVPADYFAGAWVPLYEGGLFCWAARADQPGQVTATVELVAGGELFVFATTWPQARVGWEHGLVGLYGNVPEWPALVHQVSSFKLRLSSDNPLATTFDLDSVALQVSPVPEPSAGVLGLVGSLAVSLAAVVVRFRRPAR
jgi:hypothetical protein